VLIHAVDVDLPFSRGYVHVTTHNHASGKYSEGNAMDAWIARWDNVGFDGPIVTNWREYEVADALTAGPEPGSTNISYRVRDAKDGPANKLVLRGVDLRDVTAARLALSSWYCGGCEGANPDRFAFKLRWNGGPWRTRLLTRAEAELFTAGPRIIEREGQKNGKILGAVGQVIDVALGDLVDGDNTLEIVAENVPQNYPPAAFNLDLILTTR
jgi:hypothetical protein